MRLDKWLWAARFFKTRSLASDAVDGGKVKLNDASTKPTKEVEVGDRLQLRAGEQDWEVVVQGLNEQRRPAPEAQLPIWKPKAAFRSAPKRQSYANWLLRLRQITRAARQNGTGGN